MWSRTPIRTRGGGTDFTDAESAPSDDQPIAEQSAQPSEVAAAESGNGRGADGKKARAKMSFLTSLALSFRNLLTKKGRTILTSVAGSIGIVSVCLVLALSSGFNNYVKKTEEDMLSYYPVTVTESAFDMASIMTSFTSPQDMPDLEQIGDKVYVDSFLTSLADGMTIRNNITDEYLAYLEAADPSWYSAIQYGYGATVVNNLFTNVKTEDKDGNLVQTTRSLSNLKEYYINVVQTKASEYGDLVGFADFFGDVVNVMPGTTDFVSESYSDYVLSQYDVIEGSFPANEHEIVLVVGTNNQVSDLTLAQLGFLDEEKFLALFQAGEDDSEGISDSALVDFSEIIGKEYTLYYNDAVYSENPDYAGIISSVAGEYPFSYSGTRTSGDLSAEENEGITLKISGILRLKDGLTYGCLTSGLNFTEALVQEYIAGNKQSAIVDWLQNDSSFTITQEIADQYPGLGLEDYMGVTFYISPSNNLNEDYFSNIQGKSLYCTYDLETVVRALGGDNTVTSIAIYATDFDGKEQLLSYLDAWNAAHDESEQITYSDTVGLLMGMVQQILDIITYVLVAFTAISLVVSSVMIGIITYVSVVERVKEIGVLRSLGARKQDIRNLFNAETFIIGLAAGIIGVALSYFISIFINITIQSLAGIAGIAALPFTTALLMVAISIVLTLISGLIPAQSAAKKDPVIALRTE